MSTTLSFVSELPATAEAVWKHATSLDGITWEMSPWLRMTVPRGKTEAALEASLRQGTPPFYIGRSWLLLGGLLPVDWDDLTIIALEPGRRFHERSTMASIRDWQHERTVTPTPTGCRVEDRLTFTPRLLVPVAVAKLLVGFVFRNRHRRLALRFR